MKPNDPAVNNPTIPILLDKLRSGDEHEQRVAADVLEALNPQFREIPELLRKLTPFSDVLYDMELDCIDPDVVHVAERLVELVGSGGREAVPVLVRAAADDKCYGGELPLFGAAACDGLVEALDIFQQCGDDLQCRLLSTLAGVIEVHPDCATPSLVRRMNLILECYDGYAARDAACEVLRACGPRAALAIFPLLNYRMEAMGYEVDKSVAAAEEALEAIAPDDADVRKQLDSDQVADEDE